MGSDKHKKSHKRKYSNESDSGSSGASGMKSTCCKHSLRRGMLRDRDHRILSACFSDADLPHKHSKKHKKDKVKKVSACCCNKSPGVC